MGHPSSHSSLDYLGFGAYLADAADQVVGGGFAFGYGQDFDRGGLVVGAENELVSRRFDVPDRASIAFQNSVHIEFAFAIWLE